MICIGPATAVGTLATALIGMTTPEEVKTYIGLNVEPYDTEQLNFKEPLGSFGIEMDIYNNFRLFAEHLSSPAQCNDNPGVNHAGVKFIIPSDNLTFYSGLSINDSHFDSNDKFDGPLGSIGAEIGLPGIEDDVKLYTEYLTSIKDIEKGRVAVGFKVFFK